MMVSVAYPLYDQLNHWLSSQGIQVLSTDFAGDVAVDIRVRAEEAAAVQTAISELTNGSAEVLAGEPSYQPLDQ